MEIVGPGGPELEAERIHVVYDGETGQIVHVHRSMIFTGAAAPSLPAEAARALEMAAWRGHETSGLRVLRVEKLDPTRTLRIDPTSERVVEAE